jgi:SM-20-related protein
MDKPEQIGASDIIIHDDVLAPQDQQEIYNFLRGGAWSFGAYSDSSPEASRYWYKHFAGYVKTGTEEIDLDALEGELEQNAPLVHRLWSKLTSTSLRGHKLTRCYANGYPSGAEGGMHLDSNIDTHFTVIYYPHLKWHPNFAGETVFLNQDGTDIIKSVYPRPNRLVIFPGTIPHVARGVSRRFPDLRITLMFKTMT